MKKIRLTEGQLHNVIKKVLKEHEMEDAYARFLRDEEENERLGDSMHYHDIESGKIKLPSPEERQKQREIDDAWRDDKSNDTMNNRKFYTHARHHAGGTYDPKYDMNFNTNGYSDSPEFGTSEDKEWGQRFNDWHDGNIEFDGNDNVYDDSNFSTKSKDWDNQTNMSRRARMNKRNADFNKAFNNESKKELKSLVESLIKKIDNLR